MAWIVVCACGALLGMGTFAGGFYLLLKHERHLASKNKVAPSESSPGPLANSSSEQPKQPGASTSTHVGSHTNASLTKTKKSSSPKDSPIASTIVPAAQNRPANDAPFSLQQKPPQTLLERLTETNKHLTEGDRDRLATALFKFSKLLDQANELWGKAGREFSLLGSDWSNGSMAQDFDSHRTTLRDLDSQA
jgi:hypothetical protein